MLSHQRRVLPGWLQTHARADLLALAFVIVGAALRLAYVLVWHQPFDHLYSDMANYVDHAGRIADGAALDRYDAYEPTGTSLLLSAPLALFGRGHDGLWSAAALWAVFSCFVPLAAWRWSRMLFGSAVGLWVAGLCAFWPLLWLHAGYFLAEIPAMAFLLGALWASESARRRPDAWGLPVLAGLLAGAAISVRAQLALNALILLWIVFRSSRRAAVITGSACAVVALAVIGFNSAAAGRPAGISENGGMSFFQGQCDVALVSGGRAERPFYFQLTVPAQTKHGRKYAFPGREVYDQRFFYSKGLDCIRDDGVGHVGVLVRHLGDMLATTTPWPEWEDGGIVSRLAYWTNLVLAVWLIIAAGIGLAWLIGRRPIREPVATVAAHLACAPLVALAFIGDPRVALMYTPFALTLLAVWIEKRATSLVARRQFGLAR